MKTVGFVAKVLKIPILTRMRQLGGMGDTP
jgi:hypothetical protein